MISADITLNMPDYRAAERTYQLLEQVAGRAGRGERPGNVVIQAYWPEHRSIVAAAMHDPSLFYGPEEVERRALGYPPFGSIANILVWGREASRVAEYAATVGNAVSSTLPDGWALLGPSPAPLSRLRGSWRWHALLKAPIGSDIAAAMRLLCARSGPTNS